MVDVTLEIPLRLLGDGRLFQRHHARATRVQVLHETLYGAALAGRVAAFEEDDDLLAGFLDPALNLEQFDLQQGLCLSRMRIS